MRRVCVHLQALHELVVVMKQVEDVSETSQTTLDLERLSSAGYDRCEAVGGDFLLREGARWHSSKEGISDGPRGERDSRGERIRSEYEEDSIRVGKGCDVDSSGGRHVARSDG